MLADLSRLSHAESRSISPENPTGARGAGGQSTDGLAAPAARELGQGWKVSPYVTIKSAHDPSGSMIPPTGQNTFTSEESLLLAHQLQLRRDAVEHEERRGNEACDLGGGRLRIAQDFSQVLCLPEKEQPPRREPEEIEEQVREPRADDEDRDEERGLRCMISCAALERREASASSRQQSKQRDGSGQ